ncbi:Hsp70 family protein [Aspergillus stella-maris]|uniref:Hsp70 family protein n=1 Tax=Aspergillus stella-maris TaxID=1810926 RepID=UPI003CCCD2C7
MAAPKLVVGLDFGTTFSGIAYSVGGSLEDIEVHAQWPGGCNRTSVKVPSDISYGEKGIQWGYQVGPFAEACRGVKLLLDERQDVKWPPSIDSRKLLRRLHKDAVQVTADFLRQLIGQTEEVLHRRLGLKMQELDLQYVLTVPAVWSDKAKDATMRAAVQAGMDMKNITLVSEPEAAALYSLRETLPNSIGKDDVFVVCDAGGGTADLISYQVNGLEPLRLSEVTEGTGAVCGSLLLDGRFEELLRDRMGGGAYWKLSPKAKATAITYWQDRVKPNFTGSYDDDFADVEYFIPVAGATDDPKVPIKDGFFLMSSKDMKDIFDPVVGKIEDLLEEQTTAITKQELPIKAIVLVGGFGASPYLFHRLQEKFSKLAIIQPPDGGAVHHGLEGNKINSRFARRHYGIRFRAPFDPEIDSADDPNKIWDDLEEKWWIGNQMEWYISKSSKISENEPIRLGWHTSRRVDDAAQLVFHIQMYFSLEGDAPDVYNEKRVFTLCEVEADLDQIPKELFTKKTNSKGVEYYGIFYDLVMTPTSASLIFELEFNGVSYGFVRTKY